MGSQLETTQGLAENFVTGRQYMPVSKPLLLKCQITVKSNRIEAGMQLQLALVQTAKLATAALSISKGSLQRHIHTTVSTYPVEDAVLCFPLRKKGMVSHASSPKNSALAFKEVSAGALSTI